MWRAFTLFCSVLQLKTMHLMLVGETENVIKEESVVEGKVAQSDTTTATEVETKALHHVQDPGIHHSYLKVEHLQLMSVAE